MAEKKATTKKAAETKEVKAPAAKKATTTKKAAAAALAVNAEAIGFKAGDVYQALAAAEKALDVKEIAKAAKISEEETLQRFLRKRLCSVWVGCSRRVSS